MPEAEWPDPVQRAFAHINPKIYVPMQGPSELGMSADAKLATWDRFDALDGLDIPALVIGATYDTMDPEHMARMAERLPQGRYLHCPKGSHLAMYDDQETYFKGLVDFLANLPS
jgi:proline iminopeptidase